MARNDSPHGIGTKTLKFHVSRRVELRGTRAVRLKGSQNHVQWLFKDFDVLVREVWLMFSGNLLEVDRRC